MVRRRPAGETPDERVLRKAADIRDACIEYGLSFSPNPDCPFEELPADRREKWVHVARAYCEVM